eukprot:Rmarinus@m.24576
MAAGDSQKAADSKPKRTKSQKKVPEMRHVPRIFALTKYSQKYYPWIWNKLSDLETWWYQKELKECPSPVFVGGIARGGTTITMHLLWECGLGSFVVHDAMFTPITLFHERFIYDLLPYPKEEKERIHQDGIMMNQETAEALEEQFWMAEFPQIHDRFTSSILEEDVSRPTFEQRFKDLMRKVCCARGTERYVSKNNYVLTRLAYMHSFLPDARFLIVIRHPVFHLDSYLKAHDLLVRTQKTYPFFYDMMDTVGHYEFGLDVRFINVDNAKQKKIYELWDKHVADFTPEGDLARLTALTWYWAAVYEFCYKQISSKPELQKCTKLVLHEDLCNRVKGPSVVSDILDFCEISGPKVAEAKEKYASNLREPKFDYPEFTKPELDLIRANTSHVTKMYGYSEDLWDKFVPRSED